MNKIFINDTVISDGDLISGSNLTSHAMAGETLAVDQLICVVNTEDVPFVPADQDYPLITNDHHIYFAKNDIDVTTFKDGDEMFCYDGENLAGKYFFESVAQQGLNRYKISAVSIIGRLLNSRHYGGVYTGVYASVIFADILSGTNYTLDPDVSDSTVTGYLPIATRRDNLQQLLIATGSTVRVDETGHVHISSMSDVQSGVFAASRAYIGGSVLTDKPVVGVKLTEHNYFPAGNEVTLFADGVDGEELIEFNQPYHDLKIEGGTILESGANYARISAKGTVTLTGQPYTHVTRIVTAGKVNTGSTETVKNVSSCYLANPQIAQSLAERFYSFLKCNKTITQDVLTGTERAGDVVSVINPYTMEMEFATIKKFDITMSATNKARASFLVGFVPQGVISGFKNYTLLTDSGSWTVPEGVSKIRIILVGAGTGGGGGKKGSDGGAGSWSNGTDGGTATAGTGGSGGSAGKSGAGGRVFEISLDVAPGQVFDFSCGVGGVGGVGGTSAVKATEGVEGTATTFGGYSSDYGRLYPYGYYEAKTGMTFSAAGAEGYDGGDGGDGNTEWHNWVDLIPGENGESVAGYAGGSGSYPYTHEIGADGRNSIEYSGGGGGGAAYGNKGGDANVSGGAGGNAVSGANATNYGQGGGAGHGGGGGGGGGVSAHIDAIFSSYSYGGAGGGTGGTGGAGGSGKAGCIVIYY